MNNLTVNWATLKSFVTTRGLSIQWIDLENNYHLKAFDGFFCVQMIIPKGDINDLNNQPSADQIDFETNFKAAGNKKLDIRDSDGSPLQRIKITTTGWKAQFHIIRISTATNNGVRNKNKSGADLGLCTYKMYTTSGSETTMQALAVKTVVTWEVNHDMEIIGGELFQSNPPTTDIWMYVTAAPHIPSIYGGSVVFLEGGMNLADVGIGGGVNFDGKSPKWISYDPINHSGRFEIELQHDPGIQHSFSLSFQIYKP